MPRVAVAVVTMWAVFCLLATAYESFGPIGDILHYAPMR